MEGFFWFIDLLIPALMILIGFWFIKAPPPEINALVGYRTRRSCASQEAWDFAHQVSGRYYLAWGSVLMLLVIALKLALLNRVNLELMSLAYLGGGLVFLFIPLVITERQLKDKFSA